MQKYQQGLSIKRAMQDTGYMVFYKVQRFPVLWANITLFIIPW